jgi:FO synthase
MDDIIRTSGRISMQRTSLYTAAAPDRVAASYSAPPLQPMVLGEINMRGAMNAAPLPT